MIGDSLFQALSLVGGFFSFAFFPPLLEGCLNFPIVAGVQFLEHGEDGAVYYAVALNPEPSRRRLRQSDGHSRVGVCVEVYSVGVNVCFDGQRVYFAACDFVEVFAQLFFGIKYGEGHVK